MPERGNNVKRAEIEEAPGRKAYDFCFDFSSRKDEDTGPKPEI